MPRAAITALRRGLVAAWWMAVAGLIGLALWSHLATVFVVRGASMAPTIPLGSMVSVTRVPPAEIGPGDVIVVRTDNGLVITHRVTRALALPEGRFFELKGDGNESPDAGLVPARAVVGRVDVHVAMLGYLLALLSELSGLVAVLAALGMVLVGIWWLEDLEEGRAPRSAEVRTAHGLAP
jgi:signal peptidase I